MRRAGIILVLLVAWAQFAHADDVGISTARLLEDSPGVYLIEVDASQILAPGFQAPVMPARFQTTAKPQFVQVGPVLQIRYRFSAADQPLEAGETILLPWPRTGIDLTIRWTDGDFHRGFFARGPGGIRIPVEALRETKVSRQDAIIRQVGIGARFAQTTLVIWLMVAGVAFARGRQGFADMVWLASGLALSFVAMDLGLPVLPLSVAVLLPAVAGLIAARTGFGKTVPGPGPMLLTTGILFGASYGAIVSSHQLPGLLGFVLGLLAVAVVQFSLSLMVTKLAPRRWLLVAVGSLAVAAILGGLLLNQGGAETLKKANPAPLNTVALPEVSPQGSRGGAAAPRRLESSLAAFLTVEPFEVRLEFLVRAGDLVGLTDPIPTADQAELISRFLPVFQKGTRVTIDNRSVEPGLARGDFVTVSANGVLTRPEPVPEPLNEAVLGLTWVFDTDGLPTNVELGLDLFAPIVPEVPLTITDPLGSRAEVLTREAPAITWENRLSGFEVEAIEPVPVIPPMVPAVSLGLLVIGLILVIRRRKGGPALGRLAMAVFVVAALAYPLVRMPLAGPLSAAWRLSDEDAAVVLDDLLTNIYRSFDMRDEVAIYDRLAMTVDGEQLTEIYLQSRRSLEMENRGGARGRVDEVEILAIESVRGAGSGALAVEVSWQVSGSVSHFGHTHYRQNRNRAQVTLAPVDGIWKISDIEILEEERIL